MKANANAIRSEAKISGRHYITFRFSKHGSFQNPASKTRETIFPLHRIRTCEAEQVEKLIRKVRTLRSGTSASAEQTLIGAGEAGADRVPQETLLNAGQTVAVDASTVSFLRPAQQPDEIGRLGGYRILEVLGSGGMGVVYRAEDPSLKRLIAMKVMKPTVAANPEAKARFMKEAEATAAIEHDNIVTIYQVGEDNGIPFIAMQFLKGESLQARLNRVGKLPEAETLRVGLEVANGLQAAHSRGLIHRDIKPDNIWLQKGNDRVRIVDFGLVRNNAEDAGLTQSGVVLGTPKYMAPEQARGHDVDHRCDLFSLGSVMYRMLAGKSPFEGSNLTATLVRVAAKLIDGVGDRALLARRLRLDHHQRSAVHEQRQVWPDVLRLPRRRHPKLRHRQEVVRRPVVPIDEVDRLIPTTIPAIKAGDGHATEQQIGRQPIRFQQLRPSRHRPQLCDRRVDAGLVEPLDVVRPEVDLPQRQTEPLLQEDVALRRSIAVVARLLLAPDQRVPTER